MNRILISACLVGRPVRYNGSAKTFVHPALEQWQAEGRLVVFCPEVSAGFSIPRPAAEIADSLSGTDVLRGSGRVIDTTGADVTDQFRQGAENALAVAKANDCRFALLIDGSPSCGSGFIYDGEFSGKKHSGNGVTAALLTESGIDVFAPAEIEDLVERLRLANGYSAGKAF